MRISRLKARWARFWISFSGTGLIGRIASYLAALATPPYYGRVSLSKLSTKGYVSAKAVIHHHLLELGKFCYIADGVLIYQDRKGGAVQLGDAIHLHDNTVIQTGRGGSVSIGADTHIQPRCQISAYEGPIKFGERVEIAPNCAFYSYDHGILPNTSIREQPVTTKGGIIIEDDAWLGYGVIVLDGVRIGKGAVIGAGSVVTKNIPDGGIAIGVPAKVIKLRSESETQ